MLFTNIALFQGIWCVGTIFGTGAGLTAFIFLIVNCIKDKLDDDPNTQTGGYGIIVLCFL